MVIMALSNSHLRTSLTDGSYFVSDFFCDVLVSKWL